MCGIVGQCLKQNDPQDDFIIRRDLLKHRGPDAAGFYQSLDQRVKLGHRRLAIIDLSAKAEQPMSRQGCHIVFNGEIYNFKTLRAELEKFSYKFTSQSDTEVILAAYLHYGPDCVRHLEGMFAFCIWDENKQQLFLARDRLGKKPLYYAYQDGNFFFASEIKAIIAYSKFKKIINPLASRAYFYFEYIPEPETIFQDIYKVVAGEYLIFTKGEIQKQKYWDLGFALTETKITLAEAAKRLDQLLQEAVTERLVADVPLGIFLSGGLDSSTIAWYAQNNHSSKIKTFSIAFQEASFDESKYARLVAKMLGTEHTELPMTWPDLPELLAKVPLMFDEPLSDAGCLPQYLLAAAACKHVTVALSGDGGDEVLAGYQTFQAEKMYQFYRHWPAKKLLQTLANKLPASYDYLSLDFKIKRFVNAEKRLNLRHQSWLGSFSLADLDKLLLDYNQEEIIKPLMNFRASNTKDIFDEAAAFYQKFYLKQRVLAMVDRSSMQNSLEVRCPFLDYRVVEFLNSLPSGFKLRGLNSKYLLKKLMEGRLPKEIIRRPKQGFSSPLGHWFREPLKSWLPEQLLSGAKDNNFINYTYVKKLIDEHQSGKANHERKLWTLLVWHLWYNKYLG